MLLDPDHPWREYFRMDEARPTSIIAAIGLFTLLAVYAADVVPRDTLTIEIGTTYSLALKPKTWADSFAKFLEFGDYRPLSFYVIDRVLFESIDVHNFHLIKAISFSVVLINTLIAVALARVLFASRFVECVLIFALIAVHPLYYQVVFAGEGYRDPLFMITMNIFIICYLMLLEDSETIIGRSMQLGKPRSVLLTATCCALIIFTVTLHQRGVTVFPVVGFLWLCYYRPWEKIDGLNIPATVVVAFALLLGLCYLAVVWPTIPHQSGLNYRTDFEIQYVARNFLKALELPFRFLFWRIGFWYDGHYGIMFNLFAMPFFFCLLTYIVYVCRGSDTYEKGRLVILTILFASSLPVPVFFGAGGWHFYTAAVYVSIATGRAVWFSFQRATYRLRMGLIVALFAWLSSATVHGLNQEFAAGSSALRTMSVVPSALNDKAVRNMLHVPQVIYYDAAGPGLLDAWSVGQGNLFKYIYKDPTIIEIQTFDGMIVESDRVRCSSALGKRSVSFRFNADDLSWTAIAGPADPCRP